MPANANTPLSGLGLPAAQLKMLTPAAQALTPSDLVALTSSQTNNPKVLALTVNDLNSLSKVFASPDVAASPEVAAVVKPALTISRCCCCCCFVF
jgi:hypothetical protein